MGYSLRERAFRKELARLEHENRLQAERAAQAAAEAYHAEFYDRQRAADFLGISVHKLKRLMAAGKGPSCLKLGDAKQATVRWPIGELRVYRADPAAYVAAKAR
jgi:hypothetical protein